MMASTSLLRRLSLTSHRKSSLTAILAFAAVLVAPGIARSQDTADALFARAKAEAKAEHKNVLLVFSASWCGPCKLYERFLQDPQLKPITEKAFEIQRVDVGERPGDPKHADTLGGVALRTALGAVGEPGFPFLVITDEDGNPIINSYRNGKVGDNIGYPALAVEIDWYVEMLRRAAPSLSSGDLDATRTWLRKHDPE
jgi:thiol-disulfide isomerase/thioredoxin